MSEEKEKVEIDDPERPVQATLEFGDVIDERKLLRKLDLILLPGVSILFLLSLLDRSNVGNARIEGLATDTSPYLNPLTMYFLGYNSFNIPCNIILKMSSPRLWLPTLALAWGITCTLMGLTQNLSGFLTARFFLGMAESGLFPGVLFYLSMWYKRNERLYRIALFFSSVSLVSVFSGLFASALTKMDGIGGLEGWRWIFIIEGLLTVVVSVGGYFFIYNYPATTKFLTPEEREYILARLKDDSDAVRDEKFTRAGVRQALKDSKTYFYGLCYYATSLPGYSLTLFLPTIIDGLGYSGTPAQLLLIPPLAVGFITTMFVAVLAERTGRRAPFIIGSSAVGIVGYIILLASHWPGMSYVGTIVVAAGILPATAIVLSWPANNVSGQTKRATASAMQVSLGGLGAIMGTQFYQSKAGPRYFVGHGTALVCLIGNIVFTSILWYIMKKENGRRDRGERDDRLRGADEDVFLGDDDPRWRFQT